MLPLPLALLLLLVSVAPLHVFAFSAGAGPNRSGAAAEVGKLIFILAGQSNMAGRGGVTGDNWNHVVPPECRPSPAILRLNAGLRWEEAREPLHADIDVLKTCGVGPGMAFAHEILSSAAAPVVVGLVPCALGGTKITQWGRGTRLYGEMVRRARAAGGGGGGGWVGAVLWYQGESDTVSCADAEAYKGRMEKLIRDLRSDLGLPGLLVIQVALASGEGNFTDTVRQAQKGIKLPNVVCVDAKGLALETDHLHLTTQAQVQLGKMLAISYLNHSKTDTTSRVSFIRMPTIYLAYFCVLNILIF